MVHSAVLDSESIFNLRNIFIRDKSIYFGRRVGGFSFPKNNSAQQKKKKIQHSKLKVKLLKVKVKKILGQTPDRKIRGKKNP